MDISHHNTMQTLFEQLGLPASSEEINQFIQSHSLKNQQVIHEAEFWTDSQSAFLKDAINDDADWAEIVDNLDAQLRESKP